MKTFQSFSQKKLRERKRPVFESYVTKVVERNKYHLFNGLIYAHKNADQQLETVCYHGGNKIRTGNSSCCNKCFRKYRDFYDGSHIVPNSSTMILLADIQEEDCENDKMFVITSGELIWNEEEHNVDEKVDILYVINMFSNNTYQCWGVKENRYLTREDMKKIISNIHFDHIVVDQHAYYSKNLMENIHVFSKNNRDVEHLLKQYIFKHDILSKIERSIVCANGYFSQYLSVSGLFENILTMEIGEEEEYESVAKIVESLLEENGKLKKNIMLCNVLKNRELVTNQFIPLQTYAALEKYLRENDEVDIETVQHIINKRNQYKRRSGRM